MGVLASIGASILGFVLKRSTKDFLGKIVARLAGTEDGRLKLREMEEMTKRSVAIEETKQLDIVATAGTERQYYKMNQKVFWILIALSLGPPLFLFWSVAFYNVFWWRNGWFPQNWSIAEFPPSIKPWADMAMRWLFDPIGPATGVGTALVAGLATGRRSK